MATSWIKKIKQADISDRPTNLNHLGLNPDFARTDQKGFSWCVTTGGGSPTGETSIVITCVYDQNAGIQLVFSVSSDKAHARRLVGNNWQSWYSLK